MAISLKDISRGKRIRAPRIIIYGPDKIGKSSFAASAPKPIFIQTEEGLDSLDVNYFPLAGRFQDVVDAIGVLFSEDHDFQTVVIDSADWMETLIHRQVAVAAHVDSIDGIGYGRGFSQAMELWRLVLEGLDALRSQKSMTVIMTAHHEIARYDAPDSEPYSRYQIKLHKLAASKLKEWADVIAFAGFNVIEKKTDVGFNKKVSRAVDGGRMLYLTEKPAFVAGNRFSLPDSLPFPKGNAWEIFQTALQAATTQPTNPSTIPPTTQPSSTKGK